MTLRVESTPSGDTDGTIAPADPGNREADPTFERLVPAAAEPMISVVVPTKRRLGSLVRCLEALAILDPPRGGFEVVVANDDGGAEVERVVSSFTGRMRVTVVSAVGHGPSAARNAGAAAARGRSLAFTDDDCRPAREWLSALDRALEAHPGAAVGGTVVNGIPESIGAVASQAVLDALQATYNDRSGPRFFPSSNVAFPAASFRALGGFDESFRHAEDREICARWIRSGRRFVHAPEALVVHMRALRIDDFLRQHYGYGRGAWSFRHALARHGEEERPVPIFAELVAHARRRGTRSNGLAVCGYLGLAELATAVGYAREAVGQRLAMPRGRTRDRGVRRP
jgi:GT2 family glycosyltransferase